MTEYEIPARSELRIEAGWSETASISLKQGDAEIFGTALDPGEAVSVRGQSVAVFSWGGAKVTLGGNASIVYASEDTPMASYLQVHDALEVRRREARERGGRGPVALLVGPTDAGKSTVSKILANWAVRAGWTPSFSDLDVGQGAVTVPGCVATTALDAPVDVQEGWPSDAPAVWYFGHVSPPSGGDELYAHLVDRVADALERRSARDPLARASGGFVNTMGWVEGRGYDLLRTSAASLGADVVLVVGTERLSARLGADLGKDFAAGAGAWGAASPAGGEAASGAPAAPLPPQVLTIPRSGGVVSRSKDLRAEARRARVEEYFYGPARTLAPASQTIPLDQVEVYRAGGGFRAPASALPIGAKAVADPLKLQRVLDVRELVGTLLAVSHAPAKELLLSLNVAGFIYVQDADEDAGTITYLAPRAGKLPGNLLLAGSFKVYLE